ncbi:MAG: tetratricopeptide repeat protein [Gemmatimonadota bacterium]|nr:tetratricopeptide repeat protein [Gemmatimonadota bacterium]
MNRIGAMAGLAVATALYGGWWNAALAQSAEIPPDTVSTVFVSDAIPGYGAVGGVATDGLGYVYVADFRNSVWRISLDGEVTLFADGLYGASGNAIGPRGYLYQSSFNGNFVSRISRTGAVETYATEGLSGPVGIAVNPAGELFVVNCTAGNVVKVDLDRRTSVFSESELMACPNGITFDDRGDLYVVNFNNTRIVRITPDGTATEFTDLVGAGGNGHITFARGGFYVTKFRGNQIFRVHRDGTFAPIAGTGQAGTEDGEALTATFTRPNGIAATTAGKELWVNDFTVRPPGGRGGSVVSMRRIRLVTLSDVLAQVDLDADLGAVERIYRAYHESRPGEDTATEAITLGYQWLQGPVPAAAVTLFTLNAEQFPDNPQPRFHLGEMYRYVGQLDQAAEHYRKALEIQPDFGPASARLAEVTGR